MSTDYKLSL